MQLYCLKGEHHVEVKDPKYVRFSNGRVSATGFCEKHKTTLMGSVSGKGFTQKQIDAMPLYISKSKKGKKSKSKKGGSKKGGSKKGGSKKGASKKSASKKGGKK